jgi:beta-glucosidase
MTSIVGQPERQEPSAPYPPGFRFGAATAAYQIEGAWDEDGRGESIWDRFCHTPGKVARGETGDVACDHYHRWREDMDLLAALRIESYRFSISWSRVQPDGRGALNPQGVAFYRRLAEGLLERGIEPVATLYHWDLPQALQDHGGWAERDTTERFASYAGLMAEQLGDVIGQWITHNEPWVVAFLGHAFGVKAPGVSDWPTALRVSHHLLLSHGLAVRALRAAAPAGTPVGITLNLQPERPLTDSDEDRAAARIADGYANRWFLDPVLRGSYPEDMLELFGRRFGPPDSVRPGDLEVISEPLDFLGVNYYFPQRVSADPGAAPLGVRHDAPTGPLTTMGWEQDPSGLQEILVRIRCDYGDLPIWITENGAAFEDGGEVDGYVDDPARVEYLQRHVAAVGRAIAEGVDVQRYFVWSLLDNFEWESGYAARFGIVHVDFESLRRVPKRSALWYRDHIAAARGGADPEP